MNRGGTIPARLKRYFILKNFKKGGEIWLQQTVEKSTE